MVNNLLLLGRVGVKPEIKYSKTGVGYSDLRIAINSKRKVGNEYMDHTDWFTVKIFGKTAENCVKYLDKGRMVFVEAKLSSGDFINKEGKKEYSLDIIASRVEFIGGDPSKAAEQQEDKIPRSGSIPDKAYEEKTPTRKVPWESSKEDDEYIPF
jgi:single-strand DNA-binding protein